MSRRSQRLSGAVKHSLRRRDNGFVHVIVPFVQTHGTYGADGDPVRVGGGVQALCLPSGSVVKPKTALKKKKKMKSERSHTEFT